MKLLLDTPMSGKCTREQAFATNLIPKATKSYQPMSNQELVMMIEDVAGMYDMNLSDGQFGMDLKGMRFFGVYTIEGLDFFRKRIKLMIGFCNSYNKSMSGRMCIGGEVLVCSNRAFYAYTDDVTGVMGMAAHDHRKNIHENLFQRIQQAFDGIEQFRKYQEIFYRSLSETKITQEEAYHFIIKAAQENVLNKTKILTVAEEWDWQERGPQNDIEEQEKLWHSDFRPRTAFSLFNAFTEVSKDSLALNPVATNIKTMGLTEFFCKEFS